MNLFSYLLSVIIIIFFNYNFTTIIYNFWNRSFFNNFFNLFSEQFFNRNWQMSNRNKSCILNCNNIRFINFNRVNFLILLFINNSFFNWDISNICNFNWFQSSRWFIRSSINNYNRILLLRNFFL